MLFPLDVNKRPDIYTFQESKSTPAVIPFWNKILPGQVTYSHAKNRSGGVVLGIHSSSSIVMRSSIEDPDGQFIVAECQLDEEFFTVASLYCKPDLSPAEVSQLLTTIASKIAHFGHSRVLMMGDFNIVVNPKQDSNTHTSETVRHRREVLLPFMDTHEYTDIWRAMHPFTNRYTCHGRVHGKHTLSRTDFFLVSPALLMASIQSTIEPSFVSDHNPITYQFTMGVKKGRGYWKFPNSLLKDDAFKKFMLSRIHETVRIHSDWDHGSVWDMVKLTIRGSAIDYLAKQKRKNKNKIEAVENCIAQNNQLRDTFAHDPYKAAFFADKVKHLHTDLDKIFQDLQAPASCFAKAQAHYELNRCTKYYFRLPGTKNDAIKCLYNSDGEKISGTTAILQECRQYYQKLYTQPQVSYSWPMRQKYLSLIPTNVLDQSDIAILDKEISLTELHDALKDMKVGAVPGEDGLTVSFFLEFWNEIKQYLYNSYLHAFKAGNLSLTQRRGIIRLIPKRDKNPLFVSSWRPITLLNVDYKIITKLFSKRLSLFLPKLIHHDQKGFVKGRNISENLLDLQTILSVCEEFNTEGMLILLDIEKAFDSIG